MKIFTKNVKGLGKNERWKAMGNLIHKNRPNMILLQELKLNMVNKTTFDVLGGKSAYNEVWVESMRALGTFISLWQDNVFFY